jgi:hypothetical protein
MTGRLRAKALSRGRALNRTTELKRTVPLRRKRRPIESPGERLAYLAFTGRAASQGRCAGCGGEGRWHPHHAGVEKQELKRRGIPLWDPDNALRLCVICHWRHHYEPGFRLPLSVLREENIRFAFGVLDAGAYDYLSRRYRGQDSRIERALALARPAGNGSAGQT